jgi:hypothetical protein
MWEKTVAVEHTQVVEASLERVWSLLSGPAMWSLRPGLSFAFAIPDPPAGEGRLFLSLGATSGDVSGAVFEICDEVAGQMIQVRARGTQPARAAHYTLAVAPDGRGVQTRAQIRFPVARPGVVAAETLWRRRLTSWLAALRAVAEGRVPWPASALPDPARQILTGAAEIKDPIAVSADVLIAASPNAVWQAIGSLTGLRVALQAVCCGQVPGSPDGLGAMRYAIIPGSGGQLHTMVSVVRELLPERSVTLRRVGPPGEESSYHLTPASGGTRLELAARWPAKAWQEGLPQQLTDVLQARARRWRELIEQQDQ